jgi:hypothetical protein
MVTRPPTKYSPHQQLFSFLVFLYRIQYSAISGLLTLAETAKTRQGHLPSGAFSDQILARAPVFSVHSELMADTRDGGGWRRQRQHADSASLPR